MAGIGPGVWGVVVLCLVVFVVQSVMQHTALTSTRSFGDVFVYMFALSREGALRAFLWQPLTYIFLHGSVWHLLLNLLMIVLLGVGFEREAGTRRFLLVFIVSGIAGGLGWLALTGWWAADAAFCLGASAAAFGLVGGIAGLYPRIEITLLLLWVWPITTRAWRLALLMCMASLLNTLWGRNSGVAYSAHLMGCVGGYVCGRILREAGGKGRSDAVSQ